MTQFTLQFVIAVTAPPLVGCVVWTISSHISDLDMFYQNINDACVFATNNAIPCCTFTMPRDKHKYLPAQIASLWRSSGGPPEIFPDGSPLDLQWQSP